MPYQEGPASEDARVYTISCEGELSFIEACQDPSMWLAISIPILVPLLFWWTTLPRWLSTYSNPQSSYKC